MPLAQEEIGGEQARVPLLVPVTLLSMPLAQGSETGGVQATLIAPPLMMPVALLSMPLSHGQHQLQYSLTINALLVMAL